MLQECDLGMRHVGSVADRTTSALPKPQLPTEAPQGASAPDLDRQPICAQESDARDKNILETDVLPQTTPASDLALPSPNAEGDTPNKEMAPVIAAANTILQDIVFGPDGRFVRVVRLNRRERRNLRMFEPDLETNDLESAKELIRRHLYNDRVFMVNVGFTLKEIRDRGLFSQDGFLDFSSWLKIEAKDLGISIGYAYRALSIAEALDRYLVTTFMGQWGLSVEDVLGRMKKLSYFMTGIYRHLKLEQLKGPFIASGGPEPFIAFVMGKTIPTPEENEAASERRHQEKGKRSQVVASSDLEREIVEAVQLHQEVVIAGLRDPADAKYIKMALVANRRREADKAFSARIPDFVNDGSLPKNFRKIRTIEDAKALIILHQAEGIPHRLVCAAICARLEDDPELVRQWTERGYTNVHNFLIKELEVTFDTYRYVVIGRNYLKYENIILQHVAIETDIQFSKLYLFDKAIEKHGDEGHLIWLYFGKGTTVADWTYFAQHKDFKGHFANSRMSEAQLRNARALIFEFNETKAASGEHPVSDGQLGGPLPHVFPIVAPHERRLIELFLTNPQFLYKYVQLYFDYKGKGLL